MQTVPLLDLRAQYATLEAEMRPVIDRVIDSQIFINGPEVLGLETDIAAFTGAQYAVGVSSGTDALLVALMALGLGVDDEVITTPYSFFATAGVVARLGAKPVFVDIDPATFNMDVAQLGAAVTSRTKAIMPVHLYGRMMDVTAVAAAAPGIPIVEDAAQAIGAFDGRGNQAGTVGAMGCYSFFPSKNLGGFGDGGMLVSNSKEHADRVRMLRMHGMEPKYFHPLIGGNFRLDALQAAVLRVKLKHLAKWSAARRNNAAQYRALFEEAGLAGDITLPSDVDGHIYNQFIIRSARRDELQAYMKENGIGTEVYYPVPLHLQECFDYLGYKRGDMPHSERAAAETLALPIYPELQREQLEYVVQVIAQFHGR